VLVQALSLQQRGQTTTPLVPITQVGVKGTAADEIAFVEAIERRWSIDVYRVPLVTRSVATTGLEQTTAMEMTWVNELWPSAVALFAKARSAGARSYLTGQWGDQVLYEQAYLVDLFNSGRWLTVWRHLQELSCWEEGGSVLPFLRRFGNQLLHWDIPRSLVPLARSFERRFVGPRRDQPWYTDRVRRHAVGDPPKRTNVGFGGTPVHARNLYAKLRSKYYQLALEGDDKVAASFGMRVETPFLDRQLLELVMSLPGEMTTPGGRQRGLVRDSLAADLPAEIAGRRSKSDFTAIANEAMRDAVQSLLRGGILKSSSRDLGYIDAQAFLDRSGGLLARLSDSGVLVNELADVLGLESWVTAFLRTEEAGRLR